MVSGALTLLTPPPKKKWPFEAFVFVIIANVTIVLVYLDVWKGMDLFCSYREYHQDYYSNKQDILIFLSMPVLFSCHRIDVFPALE